MRPDRNLQVYNRLIIERSLPFSTPQWEDVSMHISLLTKWQMSKDPDDNLVCPENYGRCASSFGLVLHVELIKI